jgi:hypothetical protein
VNGRRLCARSGASTRTAAVTVRTNHWTEQPDQERPEVNLSSPSCSPAARFTADAPHRHCEQRLARPHGNNAFRWTRFRSTIEHKASIPAAPRFVFALKASAQRCHPQQHFRRLLQHHGFWGGNAAAWAAVGAGSGVSGRKTSQTVRLAHPRSARMRRRQSQKLVRRRYEHHNVDRSARAVRVVPYKARTDRKDLGADIAVERRRRASLLSVAGTTPVARHCTP